MLSDPKYSQKNSSATKSKVQYKTTLYSADVSLLKKTLDDLQKTRTISYVRLKPTRKTHCIRKGPCGRGYAVFIKKQLKIHKWVLFFSDLNKLRTVSNLIKTPNVCVESSLC